MDLWYPPHEHPVLLEWWRPLLLAGAAARQARCSWPIHLDEFQLMGRVDRPSRPAIWVYKHAESRRELYLDASGAPYAYTRTPNAKSHGRFTRCDIRTAIWRADLPRFVEPMWFDEPRWSPAADDAEDPPPTTAAPEGRRRGHLTVLEGGRSMAG